MLLAQNLVKQVSPKLLAYPKALKLLIKPDSYLISTGFLNTYEKGYPCKVDGSPLPWMNYAVISFLEERLKKEFKLFEYGSGYSTLFFSKLVKQVVSVEYSQEWYDLLKKQINNRVRLIYQEYQENGEYCRVINQQNETYDVAIIDGRDRVRCALNACESLSKKGVIIFDDSKRDRYQEGIESLLQKGFKMLNFEGIQPAGFKLTRTSIFYRPENCLAI